VSRNPPIVDGVDVINAKLGVKRSVNPPVLGRYINAGLPQQLPLSKPSGPSTVFEVTTSTDYGDKLQTATSSTVDPFVSGHKSPLSAEALEKLSEVDESESFLRSFLEDDEATIFPSSSDDSCGFRTGIKYEERSTDDLKTKAEELHADNVSAPPTSDKAPRAVRSAARELARLGPAASHVSRSRRMEQLRREADGLRQMDETLKSNLQFEVRRVLEAAGPTGSHLAFLEHVLEQTDFPDVRDLLLDLKRGFPLYGVVPTGIMMCDQGIGAAKARMVRRATTTPSKVRETAGIKWAKCLSACKLAHNDGDTAVLHDISEQTRADQLSGRMGQPRDVDQSLPCPTRRFGVQQMSSKGKTKIRCIDDFNASGINDCCHVIGRLRMGRITDLVDVVHILNKVHPNEELVIFKTDFKSAYRSVPLRPEHYLYADVVYYDTTLKKLVVSKQLAMPFGAVAAVYGWDRVADALTHVMSAILLIPVSRYVDDLFGACFASHAEELRDMIVELMTMCGFTLDPEKTPLPARSQTILGIECRLFRKMKATWVRAHTALVARLDEAKTKVWIDMIKGILRVEKLEQHDAEKLAGRLNFLVWSVAGRPGAGRLSRLYTAIYRPQTVVSPGLRSDLRWWLRFLTERTSKSYAINSPRSKVVTLYTDAEGKGGIGGVIFVTNEKPLQFAFKVPKVFNEMFSHRMTYIIQLELLAVTVALKLFCHHLTGAAVKFFIDNRSVLGSLRKGRSKVEDLNSLVLMTIDKTVHIDQCLFSWIPSKLNLADLPSRGQLVTDITTVDCAEVVRSLINELRESMRKSQAIATQGIDTAS